MPERPYDDPLGLTTGAAALFAVTGGVMEAALRTAAEVVTGETLQKLDFHAVRGINNLREATVQVGNVSLNVAVATGMATVRKIVEQVLAGESKYHFVEVMVRRLSEMLFNVVFNLPESILILLISGMSWWLHWRRGRAEKHDFRQGYLEEARRGRLCFGSGNVSEKVSRKSRCQGAVR